MQKTSENPSSTAVHKIHFTKYQVFVVGVLAFLQFTIILDFMILSPLGAILMPALKISAEQFGKVVSVYAFSAGLSGILASGFADKYDRKKILLFFYSGFILGTWFCAMAPNYHLLLAARMVTGIFGGVIGSIVFAITTDLFPLEARGRVMGFIQTAFASSQILGLPIGLFLANHWGWHMPFLMIVGVSVLALLLIWKFLNPIDDHLKLRHGHSPLQSSKFRNPFQHFLETIKNKKYLQAFAATALLSTGGFMLMPFGSAFSVHNLGIDVNKLPLLYMTTGFSSIIMGPLIGRASDAYGKFKVFLIGTIITIFMVIIYTHLGPTTLGMLMLVNVFMFVGITARMIPSQALMSAVPTPQNRGAFMSVNSSIQQFSGGLASLIAGMIVVVNPEGKLEHFELIGYVVTASSLITLFMMSKIHKRIHEKMD